jgi:predicted glycosyltransferase
MKQRPKKTWAWFDIENTPHAHFLRPLADRARRSAEVRITARAHAQTLALAAYLGLDAIPIGSGDRTSAIGKASAVLVRALHLIVWVLRQGRPAVLVSCSRSACIAAAVLRIPSIVILDYEHAELRALSLATSLWMPDLLRNVRLPKYAIHAVRFFEGLKENLYLDGVTIDRDVERARLGADEMTRLVISRPPADMAHYATDGSWQAWRTVTERLAKLQGTRVIVMPRSAAQRNRILKELGQVPAFELLDQIVDGPRTIMAADLVVGGGGTVNREAAVLGTPAWSVFTGPRPHVDEVLEAEGRLTWIADGTRAANIEPPTYGSRSPRAPYPAGLETIAKDMESHIAFALRKG